MKQRPVTRRALARNLAGSDVKFTGFETHAYDDLIAGNAGWSYARDEITGRAGWVVHDDGRVALVGVLAGAFPDDPDHPKLDDGQYDPEHPAPIMARLAVFRSAA